MNKLFFSLFKNIFLTILLLFALTKTNANSNRDTLRVLFVGNSYIYYNNLPQMVSLLTDSLNTKLICKKSTFGGATLGDHWNSRKGLRTREILAKENIRDVDLQGVSITISEVRSSPDLKHALVYAAPLGGGDINKVIQGSQRCSSFLRGRLGKEMEMKSTPRLKFIADRSFDTAEDMARLLDQPKVKQDLI